MSDQLLSEIVLKGNKIFYPMTGESSEFNTEEEAARFCHWHPLMTRYIYDDGTDKYLITKTKIKQNQNGKEE